MPEAEARVTGAVPAAREDAAGSGPEASAAPRELSAAAERERAREAGAEHFGRVDRVSRAFFQAEADAVSAACWDMARRFRQGGRLLAFGEGAAASDAYHVSVEFVHPVIVGKRALPALCLEGEPVRALELLGRERDIALAIGGAGPDTSARRGLSAARQAGLLTVALAAEGGALAAERADHRFVVGDGDPTVVQEVHETLYHVLWELVHVFFDHEGLL